MRFWSLPFYADSSVDRLWAVLCSFQWNCPIFWSSLNSRRIVWPPWTLGEYMIWPQREPAGMPSSLVQRYTQQLAQKEKHEFLRSLGVPWCKEGVLQLDPGEIEAGHHYLNTGSRSKSGEGADPWATEVKYITSSRNGNKFEEDMKNFLKEWQHLQGQLMSIEGKDQFQRALWLEPQP